MNNKWSASWNCAKLAQSGQRHARQQAGPQRSLDILYQANNGAYESIQEGQV